MEMRYGKYRIYSDIYHDGYVLQERHGSDWKIVACLKSWREVWAIIWNQTKEKTK